MILEEAVAGSEVGHLQHHAELRAAYLLRGAGRTLPELLTGMAPAAFDTAHRQVHQTLHAEHNALGAATPLPETLGSTGHMLAHAALRAAHNLRQATQRTGTAALAQSHVLVAVRTTARSGSSVLVQTVAMSSTGGVASQQKTGTSTLAQSHTLVGEGSELVTVDPADIYVMPGSLPGWNRVYAEDFTRAAAIGQIKTVYSEIPQYENFNDTSGNGLYSPNQVLSAGMRPDIAGSNGVLDFHIRTVNGQHLIACPVPGGYVGRTRVRHSIKFKVAQPMPGYKAAILLWTNPDEWDEELDFVEGSLNNGTLEHNHHAFENSVPYPVDSGYDLDGNWHVATVEITDKSTRYYVDGQRTLTGTRAIPVKPKRSAMQIETNLNPATPPADTVEGHFLVDWYTIHEAIDGYDYTTTTLHSFVAANGPLPAPWTVVRGAGQVDANRARLVSPTTQWSSAQVKLNTRFTDGKITAFRVQPPPTGGSVYIGFRFNGDTGYVISLGHTGTFRMGRWVNASLTVLGNTVTLDMTGALWNIAVEPSAGGLKARAWKDGTTEPSTWDIAEVFNYNELAGDVVMMVQTSVAGTAATGYVDDLRVYVP